MKAQVAPLEGNKVKVSVDVEETEVDEAIGEAFARFSRELRVPGFRPGKVPRQVLEARLGRAAARSEALREHVPTWYNNAIRDNHVEVIAQPDIKVTAGEDSGPLSFEAVVEVRPHIKLVGYEKLHIKVPSPLVTEDDIDKQVDRLRANFAELEPVEREVRKGDQVVIDMSATRDGQPVAGADLTDYSVEVGGGSDLPELDDNLPGTKAGQVLNFEAVLGPGDPAQVEVLVKQVQEKILPAATDEWAAEASEFSTLAELRDDIRKRLSSVKRMQSSLSLQNGAMGALVELVNDDPPEPLVDVEVQHQAEDFGRRLDAQGVSLERYLEAIGRTVEQVLEDMREQAIPAVKADMALRAVVEAEGIEPSEAELEHYIVRLAAQARTDPVAFKREVERAGRRQAVLSDLKRAKAFDWLIEHAEIVDDEGKPVDLALLQPESQGADIAPGPDRDSAQHAEHVTSVPKRPGRKSKK
jgi:trigger factor